MAGSRGDILSGRGLGAESLPGLGLPVVSYCGWGADLEWLTMEGSSQGRYHVILPSRSWSWVSSEAILLRGGIRAPEQKRLG